MCIGLASSPCHFCVPRSSLSIHAGLPLQALAILRERNQDAFFGLLAQNINKLLPIIYTPTVGDACKNWSALLQRPQGLYVSIKDKVTIISSVKANATNTSLLHSLDALCARMQTSCHTPVRINPIVCRIAVSCYTLCIVDNLVNAMMILLYSGQRACPSSKLAGRRREDCSTDRWGTNSWAGRSRHQRYGHPCG